MNIFPRTSPLARSRVTVTPNQPRSSLSAFGSAVHCVTGIDKSRVLRLRRPRALFRVPADQAALSRCSRQFLSLNLTHLLAFSRLAFTTPGALGLTLHDFDRVSRSPSSTCTARPTTAASSRSLCTFRACRSVKSVPSEVTRLLPLM